MTIFKIDIISDTVCPWCFVGQRKLHRAISLYKSAHPDTHDTFLTTWHAYQLNPQFPSGSSIDKHGYYLSKFGAAQTEQIHKRLLAAGKDVDVHFKFGGMTGNSRDSHRVVAWAKKKDPESEAGRGLQDRVMEEIFKAYFEQEKDITKEETLTEAAVQAGLQRGEVKEWVESGAGGEEVDREVQSAVAEGVTGVPTFTLQGKYRFSGALEADEIVKLFERIDRDKGGRTA
jgi:predicted DsbA family dithiol-disulfide isomerase